MKLNFTLLSSFILFSTMVFSQSWEIENVFPRSSGGYNVPIVIYGNGNSLYALSESDLGINTDNNTWTNNAHNLGIGTFESINGGGGKLFIVDRGYGFNPTPRIFSSSDNGSTWNIDTVGLGANSDGVVFKVQYAGGKYWLMHRQNPARSVLVYNENNSSWEKSTLPTANEVCSTDDAIFAVSLYELQKSTDGGDTWSKIPVPNNYYVYGLATTGNTIVITTTNSQDGRVICISNDNGETWEEHDVQEYTSVGNLGRQQLTFVYAKDNLIVAPLTDTDNSDALVRVIYSTDGGVTFKMDEFEVVESGLTSIKNIGSLNGQPYVLYNVGLYTLKEGTNTVSERYATPFSVYPNPASEIVTFNESLSGSLVILNASGSVVEAINMDDTKKINIGHLENGIYFIKYQNATYKFVKQ